MAFENVRPFRLDTSGFDNALSGYFGAVKQRNDQAEFDAGTVGLIDTLMPNQNALSQPTMAPQQPQQPAILQAGYGRESGPGAVAGGSVYDRIKKFEGYTPKAQWDYQQHSVGYGTKAKYPGEVIDKPEAERRFKAEVDGARAIVEQVAPNAPPGWKDALTSLTYNSGGKWARSGLGAAIQKGDYQEAARIYAQYNKAGGKTLPGLVNRRQEELGWTQGGNGQPVRTADAGGNQQTAVLEWARRNPRHPTAQAILQKYVTQQMDPNADLERMKTEAEIQKLQRDATGQGRVTYGTTPYFTEDGRPYVTGSDGSTKYLDLGGSKPLAPGELANQKAAGAATGKAIGEARAALPAVVQSTAETLGLLDSLENDPYLDKMVGAVGGRTPDWSEDANRVAAKMAQVSGTAFLTAFQKLRGGGQITEVEGRKATEAISRLENRKQGSPAYREAIADLRRIARNGLIRAQVDAGQLPPDALGQLHNFETVSDLVNTQPQQPEPRQYREIPQPQAQNPRAPGYQPGAPPAPNTYNPRGQGYQPQPPRTLDAGDGFTVKVK